MNKTGTYIFDERLNRVVKVSDEIPSVPAPVWFPKSGVGYFDKPLQTRFESNTQKRNYLKEKGLKELPQTESDSVRYKRCAEIVNDTRKKQGLKPKTVAQLRGDNSPK